MYLDFRAEIGARGAAGYEVILRAPDGGEAAATLRMPVTEGQLEALASRIPGALIASSATTRHNMRHGDKAVRDLGALLFNALLGDAGRSMFAACRHQAVRAGKRLRLVLQIRPPELACLPWEFMFDESEQEYVCLITPLIRYPRVLAPVVPMKVRPPLQVLGMVARPSDQETLATEDEKRRLHHALSQLERVGLIKLAWVEGQTWRDLRDAMRHGSWHVFHFIGHGGFDPASREGFLALSNDDASTYQLGADGLGMLLRDHRALRLVVLNACDTGRANVQDPFSSVAGTLVRRGVPSVLAMQYEISDEAAVEFSRTFYEGLAKRFPVDVTVMEARQAVRLALPGSLEWGTPVLYMRSADGVLFGPASAPAAEPRLAGLRPDRPHADQAPLTATPRRPQGTSPDRADAPAALAGGETPRSAPPRGKLRNIAAVRTPGQVNAVAFTADSSQLALACDKHLALVVDLIGRERLRVRHSGAVTSVWGVGFDGPGRRLVTTGGDKTARIWDTATGEQILMVSHSDTVRSVAFSPDGKLATGSLDRSARIWDATTGAEVIQVLHTGAVLSVAFSPNGQMLATGSDDEIVLIWEAASGGEVLRVTHNGTVRSVAFSPDGRLLATAGTDGTARLWDVVTGEQLMKVSHAGAVNAVAFSPDGQLLATASRDGTARLWDAVTGEQLMKVSHAGAVRGVAFSPDGRLLATGGQDGAALLWQLSGESDG